jgi:hypothetical protein
MVVTRDRDELFVYGGYVSEGNGAYVAKLDPVTLREAWRVYLRAARDDHWNWFGVVGVHGNGSLYAIAGNLLARINPHFGETLLTSLPEHPGQGGAAYNGFVISPGGVIFAKSMERGHPCDGDKVLGLACCARNDVPAFLVAVDPGDLHLKAQIETREPVIGRIMTEQHNGVDYVYCPGVTRLWRFIYKGDSFEPDPAWGPVRYVEGHDQPATGVGLMGDWAVFQTNFLPSSAPLTIWAVNIQDSSQVHRIQPFPTATPSQEFSKPALDPEHMRVYTNDQLAGEVAALDFDSQRGFTLRWKARQRMESFWALTGDRAHRQAIGTDRTPEGDRVIWRDAASGKEIARSAVLDQGTNAGIVCSGFDGRYYYMAEQSQKILEITPVAASDQESCSSASL